MRQAISVFKVIFVMTLTLCAALIPDWDESE